MSDELFKQAISIFHREKLGLPQPGDVIAHENDDFSYTVRSIDQEKVTAFYVDENRQEVVRVFPTNEVFNLGAVLKIARRLQSQMN